VHERAAALFTVWVAQYAPAALHGEEDRILVSKLTVRIFLGRWFISFIFGLDC